MREIESNRGWNILLMSGSRRANWDWGDEERSRHK